MARLAVVAALAVLGWIVAVSWAQSPPTCDEATMKTLNGYIFENAQLRLRVSDLEVKLAAAAAPKPAPTGPTEPKK